MDLQPRKIYEDFRLKRVDKAKTVELLVSLIETIEDDKIRKDSIETLNKIDITKSRVFKFLENILISDSNEDLRYSAAKVIKSRFLKKSIIPFLWVLQNESSYNCLITIITSLEEISDARIESMLIEEIKRIDIPNFKQSLESLFKENLIENYSHKELAKIIINYITINYLKTKFTKFKFQVENGLITDLDFSEIDNQIIYWRDRRAIQEYSDVIGIQNLPNLKKIQFFPLGWTFNNEFTFQNSISLIKALERLNNNVAKETLISQINQVAEEKFTLPRINQIENLSISRLCDILRNYLTIAFLAKKHSQLEYEIKDGEIIEISLENEKIITLPEIIKHFSSLRSLIVKNCNLYNLPESIGTFKHLEVLNLERNSLKAIPKFISYLSSLKYLNLNNNEINTLPYSIGQLTNLEYLNLETNNLIELPKSIGYLSSLKSLLIGKNKLSRLPLSIGLLKELQELDLHSNMIITLPESIGLLYSLAHFNLDNNLIESLPNSINSITTLKTFKIEDNRIRSLPESLGLLKSLEILKLGWNKLRTLPISIGSLLALKHLRLTNNKLCNFPNSICGLTSLECLEASENKIEKLPEQIGKLKNLKILKMSDNMIKILPDSICFLNSLIRLDFNENIIEYLPESLGSLSSLEEIWLNGNQLKYLPPSIGDLPKLKKLKLNYNKLTHLPKCIEKIPFLEDISLNWKNIENISDFPQFLNKSQ